MWNPSLDDEKNDGSTSRRYGFDKRLNLGRPELSFTDLLSGFGSQLNSPRDFSSPTGDQANSRRQTQDHGTKFNFGANNWSVMPPGLSLNLMDASLKVPGQGFDNYHSRGDVRYGAFGDIPSRPDHHGENQQANWLMPPPISPYLQIPPQSREMMPKSTFALENNTIKPKEGNCKLFGALISNSVLSEPALSHRNTVIEQPRRMHVLPYQPCPTESDQRSDHSKSSNFGNNPVATIDQEKQFHSFHPITARESKGHTGSTRSCTKVSERSCLTQFAMAS